MHNFTKYIIIITCVIVITTMISYTIAKITDENVKTPVPTEHFNEKYGIRCLNCENKTFGECLECSDCGYCLNKKSAQCVKGDIHGPYTGTCNRWIHNDPWSNVQWTTPLNNNSRT